MAKGFSSLHPITEATLRQIGVTDGQVLQGYGDAAASVGYHLPVGSYNGRQFSHCFDLSFDCATPDILQRLLDAAVVPFVRDWPGNEHIHCVHIGLKADDGAAHLLPGPRSQLVDALYSPRPLDGLADRALLRGYVADVLTGTAKLRQELQAEYEAWLPDVATKVFSPEGNQIQCYAWMEGNAVVAEVRLFAEWWDCDVTGDADHVQVSYKGTVLDLSAGNPYFDGRHWRCGLRAMAEALNLGVGYQEHGAYATVYLTYPGQAAPIVPPSMPARVAMVDLSLYDADVDFHALRAGGVPAVFLKASEHDFQDPLWKKHRAAAESAEVLIAPYHYFTHTADAWDQAKRHCEIVGDFTGLLPSAVDVEDPAAMSVSDLSRSVRAYIEAYESIVGVKPVIYSYPYFWTTRMQHTFGDCDLWAASYPSNGLAGKPIAFAGWPQGATFWQWCDNGTVPGVNRLGGTDRDVFLGTEAQLRARIIT